MRPCLCLPRGGPGRAALYEQRDFPRQSSGRGLGELEGGGGCEGGVGGRRPGLLEADSWAPGYCPKAQYTKCTVKCLRGNKPIGAHSMCQGP